MSRVSYSEKRPGDTRSADWIQGFFDDLASATGAVDRDNVREEGIRFRNLAGPTAYQLGTASTDTVALAATQAWGPVPVAPVQWTGSVQLVAGDILRVRGSIDCPSSSAVQHGIPNEDMVELRIGGTIAGIAWVDAYSATWHQPGHEFNDLAGPVFAFSSNGLATFATYVALANVTVSMLELQVQITAAASLMVGYGSLVADVFRRT